MIELVQIDEPEKKDFSLFSYGFRPFFLAAGIAAIVPIIPWIFYLLGMFDAEISLPLWHAHEMLFGFVAAGISGFLLTAVPNWTNTPALTGVGLKRLVYFWLMGRVAFWCFLFFEHPIFGYLLFLDLLLPIAQLIRLSKIIIKTKNKRNFVFIGILAMLATANLLIILELNDITADTATMGAILAPNIVMLTIGVIGGRVTPSFTRAYFAQRALDVRVQTFPIVEKIALLLLAANAVVDVILPDSFASYFVALCAAVVHGIRLSQWQSLKTLANPLVWVLHVGYFWLVIALFLKGSEALFGLPYHLYLHAFTVGAIGVYLLGIMSRASLGHTGRQLIASRRITVAYILVCVAAIIRISTPFFPDYFSYGMAFTSVLWVSAFGIFLWVYYPILTRPRIDGKPG